MNIDDKSRGIVRFSSLSHIGVGWLLCYCQWWKRCCWQRDHKTHSVMETAHTWFNVGLMLMAMFSISQVWWKSPAKFYVILKGFEGLGWEKFVVELCKAPALVFLVHGIGSSGKNLYNKLLHHEGRACIGCQVMGVAKCS